RQKPRYTQPQTSPAGRPNGRTPRGKLVRLLTPIRRRPRMSFRCFAALLAPLVAALATAAGPAQPSTEDLEKAIRDLSSKNFFVREKASALLWSAGRRGERALVRALPKADLETARRAEKILEKFRWGIYPDTPRETLALIAKY